MTKYVGLSVSFCIKAILSGDVHPDMVEYIIPGFRLTNGKVPENYYENFWSRWSRPQVDAVLSQVKFVERPEGVPAYNIARGEWVPLEFATPETFGDWIKRLPSEHIRRDQILARIHGPDRKWFSEE